MSRFLLLASLCVAGCGHAAAARPDTAIRIVATDRGFEAPQRMSAGLRRIVFENRGASVHEAMLVKLPRGMNADRYARAVKAGELFPAGALDYSGPGLTAPGESVEVWVRVDAGDYVLTCWNGDHPSTVPMHRFEFVGVLHAGSRVIRVETPGPSMHEVDIFHLRGNAAVADLNRWRKREDA